MQLINRIQAEVLQTFSSIPQSSHFYLTGGTALSYFYLKHRKSNDLDFFTAEEEIITTFSRLLEDALRSKAMRVQRQRQLHSFVELIIEGFGEATVVHLACDAAFRFEPTREFSTYPKLRVDSLTDIAANKLLALFGRATLRDFIDVYFLIKESGFTANVLIDKAKSKDPGFDLYWLAVALERMKTFKDDSVEMLLLLKPVEIKEMAAFFEQWRLNLGKDLL